MPSFRHLRPDDYRVMPWKNGLGTTTEIAVDPPGAALDAFTWRLSIADLGASGPFSPFPGYDRILVQIEGAPMTLTHEGRGDHRLALLVPHCFPGEIATHGTLDAPPARDLNVMVRRERASAVLGVHQLAAEVTARGEGEADTWIVYLLRGAATVRVDGEVRDLGANETLIATSAAQLAVTAAEDGTVVFLVAVGAADRFAT